MMPLVTGINTKQRLFNLLFKLTRHDALKWQTGASMLRTNLAVPKKSVLQFSCWLCFFLGYISIEVARYFVLLAPD